MWRWCAPYSAHLIARNAVVYVPSMSVLQLSPTRNRISKSAKSAVFIGVYDAPKEAGTIYHQMDHLATSWKGRAACGVDVTKRSFSRLIDRVNVVHYRGHYVFSGDNITQQSLVMSSGVTDGSTEMKPYVSTLADKCVPDILHVRQKVLQQDDQSSVRAINKIINIDLRPIIDEVEQDALL